MRFLIAGSKGQVGRALEFFLKRDGADVFALDFPDIDITDKDQVDRIFSEYKPTHIINAAAYNAVDKAEDESDAAFAVNATGPANLAMAARKAKAVLVHYSTDYVFDGETESDYTEDDRPSPLSTYGWSKLLGEQAVAAIHPSSYMLRTSWVFAPDGVNFISRLMELANAQSELSFIDDQFCTPTYASDLALVTLELIKRQAPFGMYHAGGGQVESPFTWAKKALELANIKIALKAVSAKGFKTEAQRPRRAVLANTKLQTLGIKIPAGSERLKDFFAGRIEVKL